MHDNVSFNCCHLHEENIWYLACNCQSWESCNSFNNDICVVHKSLSKQHCTPQISLLKLLQDSQDW